jgi:hypothetical protein
MKIDIIGRRQSRSRQVLTVQFDSCLSVHFTVISHGNADGRFGAAVDAI